MIRDDARAHASRCTQHALCADAIGGIARCAKPRLYTRHGFFEAYDCGWALVEAFECADQDLAQDEHSRHGELPGGTGDVWASMTALRRIDVSGNNLKGSLPPLWGNIPDLHDLDASDNPGLSDLPFRICAGSSAGSCGKCGAGRSSE